MIERVRFTTYHNKQILVVDVSNCSSAEIVDTLRTVPDFVTVQPLSSVLLLADFTNASFNEEAVRVLQEVTVFDKPYIKKAAWAGAERSLDSLREKVSQFSRREFTVFKNHLLALEWLTQD